MAGGKCCVWRRTAVAEGRPWRHFGRHYSGLLGVGVMACREVCGGMGMDSEVCLMLESQRPIDGLGCRVREHMAVAAACGGIAMDSLEICRVLESWGAWGRLWRHGV